jgi:BirA family biotin operon repressor/biotin-[acetyl-CoA-carboxylase] ligase
MVSPKLAPAQVQLLSLAAALAVSEVLETIPGLEGRIGIKWPTTCMLDGGKVAGILLESSMDGDRLRWAVAGIGLNVNSDPAALLEDISGRAVGEWRGKNRLRSLWAPV